jgi:hypothetical protein
MALLVQPLLHHLELTLHHLGPERALLLQERLVTAATAAATTIGGR